MRLLSLALLIFSLLLLPQRILANSTNQFVNIVNPVRISSYNTDPQASLQAQYQEVKSRFLPATWLLTYDALLNQGIVSVVKNMDSSQELGLFMEVTPKLAVDAGVNYNQTDSWHRANSLFLVGYTQSDRIKLIDTLFKEFYVQYNKYPRSVGSWWIDSYSLEYMKAKYQVTADLTCADQFSTDGYQLWGQYWSTPYYPSSLHAGIPASDLGHKLDLVTIQWAARDPIRAYGVGSSSLYSIQDYLSIGLNHDYFEKLVNLYAYKHGNQFGQMTVGLEADLPAASYQGMFAHQLDIVAKKAQTGDLQIVTMDQFSNWYRQQFPQLSPSQFINSTDLLTNKDQVIWYQSPHYRIGLLQKDQDKMVQILDWRIYSSSIIEPYYQTPLGLTQLSINTPALIDTVTIPGQQWSIPINSPLQISNDSDQVVLTNLEKQEIHLNPYSVKLVNLNIELPQFLSRSSLIYLTKEDKSIMFSLKDKWLTKEINYVFRDLNLQTTYLLRSKKVMVGMFGCLGLLIVLGLLISRLNFKNKRSIISLTMITLLGLSILSYYLLTDNYQVSQSEIDALYHLSTFPRGEVLVIDQDCLQCSWHSTYRPASMFNKKSYIQKFSSQPIRYDKQLILQRDQAKVRAIIEQSGARYIYLTKVEGYEEKLPLSPGDYGIEKIYENANATIWRIKG